MATDKVFYEKLYTISTLLMMGLFWEAARGLEGSERPQPKISPTYPTMMALGTVLPYSKKIQNIYKYINCVRRHLSSVDISIF